LRYLIEAAILFSFSVTHYNNGFGNNFRDLDMTEVTFLCAFCACQISLETIKLLFKLTLTEAEQEKRNENRTLLTKLKSIFQYRF